MICSGKKRENFLYPLIAQCINHLQFNLTSFKNTFFPAIYLSLQEERKKERKEKRKKKEADNVPTASSREL